jgi:hypothetical protein
MFTCTPAGFRCEMKTSVPNGGRVARLRLETLKKDFKEASISTLFEVGKKLLEGYTKQKLESLLK